jgi:hypothetical protein
MRGFPIVLAAALSIFFPRAASAVTVKDLRIAFEQRGDHLFVREMLTLEADEGDDAAKKPYEVPLPTGARRARIATGQGEAPVPVSEKRIVIEVPKTGRVIQIMCELPVLDGVVALDQRFKSGVKLAHAALITTDDRLTMKGDRFSRPETRETPEGLPALFTVGQQFDDGHIRILLTGFAGGGFLRLDRLATILSFGMLAVGFFFWLRRAMAKDTTRG